jgi:precorrin-3B methylase
MGCTWGQKWLFRVSFHLSLSEPIKKWDHVLQKLGGTIILTFTTVFFV